MSLADDILKLRKKRLEEEERKKKESQKQETQTVSSSSPLTDEILELRKKRLSRDNRDNDIAPFPFANEYLTVALSRDESELNDILNVYNYKNRIEQEKVEEAKRREGFFQSAKAFDDGWQFGDVLKTVGGTVGDTALGIVQGAGGMLEGIADLVGYGVAGVADLLGADNFADDVKKSASHETVRGWLQGADDFLEDYSVLGNTSDAVAEGIGQVGTLILTGGLGGGSAAMSTAITTGMMGASSMGHGMSEAYQGGATDGQAMAYGALKGAIDAGTELIFGGMGKGLKSLGFSKGLSSADDMLAKILSSKISNTFFKNLTQFGVKAAGEGFEELLAGIGTAAAKQIYDKKATFGELLEDENLFEQFVVGAITSGITQSGGLVKSVKNGTDFITGLNKNETAVVDKWYESKLKEAESEGKKLTDSQKNKLYEEAISDMDKGRISIDLIEEVLGGDTYKSYKETVDSEESLKKELDELRKMPMGERNDIQNDRLTELKAMDFSDTSKRDSLKSQLSKEVSELAKGTRLSESYNEKVRRSQAFEADLTKYDEKQREIVKRAVDSGILNNTRRTHEFVDLIAKISADKGVLFDFTNNAKLKESGFALEGKTINGFVKDGNIAINIQSAKALDSVVGHEITHVLEGTELYAELQQAVKAYATTKGEYDARLQTLTKLYEGIEGADIEAELTADLVGDYLFTDESFVNSLSTEHRNIFQKIFNEIKYLCRIATAGSKEARELEKVKRVFENAYRENENQSAENAKLRYDVSEDKALYQYIQDSLSGKVSKKSYHKLSDTISDRLASDIEKIVGFSVTGYGNEISPGSIEHINNDHGTNGKSDQSMSDLHDLAKINYVIENYDNIREGKESKEYKNGDGSYAKTIELQKKIDDKFYYVVEAVPDAKLKTLHVVSAYINKNDTFLGVAVSKDPSRYVQDELQSNVSFDERLPVNGGQTEVDSAVASGNLSNNSIPQNSENATRFSLSEDSDGRQLTVEQQEYFKDSKIRDENGNLKVMYHGSHEAFTVFDKKKAKSSGYYGNGFYFTDSNSHAKQYGNTYDVYLNITNPLQDGTNNITKDQLRKFVEVIAEDEDYGIDNYGYDATVDSVINSVYGKSDFAMLMDINASCVGNMVEAVELFNKVNGTDYNGIVASTETVAFYPNQIKSVTNANPTSDTDIRYSMSNDENIAPVGGRFYGKDIMLETEDIAPVMEAPVSKTETTVAENAPVAPVMEEEPVGDRDMFPDDPMLPMDDSEDRMLSLDDDDVPVWESDSAPEPTESSKPDDPFEERDWKAVGNRKTKAYMYENPEVKPFFQEAAEAMLGDLQNSVKGERWYNDELYYESGGEYGYSGTERQTTDDIAYLLDEGHYTYAEIEKGLKAIIEDNGKENNACSKRIEFLLNDRLRDGYTDINGYDIPPNQDYLNLLDTKNVTEYSEESWNALFAQADNIVPTVENTDPVTEHPVKEAENKTANIVYDEMSQRKKLSAWQWSKEHILSHGAVFEDLSLKTGNRELQARFDMIRRAESMAQHFIGKGKNNVSALNDVRSAVESSGKAKSFNDYMYHLHNIDRMSLETEENRVLREGLKEKFKGYSDKQIEKLALEWIRKDTPEDHIQKVKDARAYVDSLKEKNKPVFGDDVTAEVSKGIVAELEAENPEFKEYAEEIYGINRYLREMLVENGVISRETSELWEKIYPHYVPIHRVNKNGMNVNVPLDTNRTGVNAPIKRAKGGNDDFYDLFRTMAERVEQTYKAVTKNRFGVELKNTLETTIESENVGGLEEVLDSLDQHEELLQKGENGENPTFTVFENGKRVKFEITDEMYEAMKPSQFTYTNKTLNTINNARRNVLTTYSPMFALTNPIKDLQDILMNSQHPARTYAAIPRAVKEIMTNGQWYQERMENGGDQDTYFNARTKDFKKEKSGLAKAIGFPFEKIHSVNEIIEQVPRLAEYIASREMGRSIDVSMLDAARVTTNFGASGDFTNMLNRNGATFLSASVEGFNQQVRNIREAKAQGLKGWAALAGKTIAAGLPAMVLNYLLWDDDEEYEELSDYVKQNYYIVAKLGDGKFVRIPKGRTVAVIQDAFKQMENLITGDDEVDLMAFADLVSTNLAPNNFMDNNIIAPITQAIGNKAWYGGDLVPTRLQDLPAGEQFDETTDSISKWLGEATNTSPYKWNYILDQYSGGVGDIVLPYLTPSADGGGLGAAMRDKFTTDSTLNNQNVTDFYDTKDKLTANANSMYATNEDVLMSKYINSINAKMGELYGKKREIQNSNLSDKEKNAQVRELQSQINDLAREGLNTYGSVNVDGIYATVGDLHYRLKDGEWSKITDDQLDKQTAVTSDLGISPSEYWSNKNEYDFIYEYPEKYEFFSNNGISYDDYANADEVGKRAYNWAYENPGKYTMSKVISDDFMTYYGYRGELNDIEADKDEDGKSISGSKKTKVINYINNMDLDYGQKIILFRSMYSGKEDRANYNADIVEYLNSRDDISYEEMVTILKELDMKVSSDGTVTWD